MSKISKPSSDVIPTSTLGLRQFVHLLDLSSRQLAETVQVGLWLCTPGPQEAGERGSHPALALVWHGGRLPKKEACFSSLSLGLSRSRGKATAKRELGCLGPVGWGPYGAVARFLTSKVQGPGQRPGLQLVQGRPKRPCTALEPLSPMSAACSQRGIERGPGSPSGSRRQ